MTSFQANDPSLDSQWRSIILFGKNSATYKFAFAKTLLELVNQQTTSLSLKDLSEPFLRNILEHLKNNDKQGSSSSSTFLNSCRSYLKDELTYNEVLKKTEQLGFKNVIDAFQNVNGEIVAQPFYYKDFSGRKKNIVITDELLKLRENFHFQNFEKEVESRWCLVETAWNLNINRNLLKVSYDQHNELLFVKDNFMRRKDVTSARDALNGYQKGKCFYSFKDISINCKEEDLCNVDHFLPHKNKREHFNLDGTDINGVWNLVLADPKTNKNDKKALIPKEKYLMRLYNRNEFYIESKHPLAETIINQTGLTKEKRKAFLIKHFQLALDYSGGDKNRLWSPKNELPGTF